MEHHYPLWLSCEIGASKPKEAVWISVCARDDAGQELRYGRFAQNWKEAPTLYTDITRRTECAQIAPRPRKARMFDILRPDGTSSGSVSLERGKTLKCTFRDAETRELAAVHRAPGTQRSARLPLIYTLGYNGTIVWRLEYRVAEGVLRVEAVQPLDEDEADFLLSGLCAVMAYKRV